MRVPTPNRGPNPPQQKMGANDMQNRQQIHNGGNVKNPIKMNTIRNPEQHPNHAQCNHAVRYG